MKISVVMTPKKATYRHSVSVVINTLNEVKNLPRAVASVKDLASEIVVTDMGSTDGTIEVARKLGAKVFSHKKLNYVEPARNFAVGKAQGPWILILDADEEIPQSLVKKIKQIVGVPEADYYRLPRKNIIFGKWIEHTRWWPDYNIRFFKKGFVSWGDEIHSVPFTQGKGFDLPQKSDFAITHFNYEGIIQYLERMLRYTEIESKELMKNGYVFSWRDLVRKPLGEFLSRYFAGQGYKDGVHGLALSLLQSFSELTLYLRVWETQGFSDQKISRREISLELGKSVKDLRWWIRKEFSWLRFLMSR